MIDVVVVYKVDRLTRSLAGFAKLVELFDTEGVAFVSVTQSFNTTSSMGRVTLSMLLSFAQFEREVTGERIRDKIAGRSPTCCNRVYVGELNHKGASHPGEHAPIVAPALFDGLQEKLTSNRNGCRMQRAASGALLLGRIFDDRSLGSPGRPLREDRAQRLLFSPVHLSAAFPCVLVDLLFDFLCDALAQSRGSIASSSQQRWPKFFTNQR